MGLELLKTYLEAFGTKKGSYKGVFHIINIHIHLFNEFWRSTAHIQPVLGPGIGSFYRLYSSK